MRSYTIYGKYNTPRGSEDLTEGFRPKPKPKSKSKSEYTATEIRLHNSVLRINGYISGLRTDIDTLKNKLETVEYIELITAPFILIIESIFLFCYKLTNNYGISIVLLSLGISLILLPVFIFIEKAKKKNDIIKAKMQAHIDEIKRALTALPGVLSVEGITMADRIIEHIYLTLKAVGQVTFQRLRLDDAETLYDFY